MNANDAEDVRVFIASKLEEIRAELEDGRSLKLTFLARCPENSGRNVIVTEDEDAGIMEAVQTVSEWEFDHQ